eukprot:TRINITY_DN1334_c0_g1_i5.p1 TRINITY_DN1334_c0_g1~~TRINITY_DN1334_c0_g1_i5.p1  ORF type:complete len:428 (+),score=119.42 TRINITY_DN1334_c0_g1_i5:143-1426(+)
MKKKLFTKKKKKKKKKKVLCVDTTASVFKGNVVDLTRDLHGNHVIQKCVQYMSAEDNQFIYDVFSENLVKIANHRYGCCVLQGCLDHGTREQKEQVVRRIEDHCMEMVTDPFGNYLIQTALELGLPGTNKNMLTRMKGQIPSLSLQKYSSNVVEKFVHVSDEECLRIIIHELVYNPSRELSDESTKDAQNDLIDVASDCYGNYVVQACLTESCSKAPKEHLLLLDMLEPCSSQLKTSAAGLRLVAILNKNPPPKKKLSQLERGGLGMGGGSKQIQVPSPISQVIKWNNLTESVLVVDVREEIEYNLDHFQSSINIPMGEFIRECTQPVMSSKFARVKSAPVVAVYCGSGVRAKMVADFALSFGLNMCTLESGYDSYKAGLVSSTTATATATTTTTAATATATATTATTATTTTTTTKLVAQEGAKPE